MLQSLEDLAKFFADTSDISEIERIYKLGIISGITTNPVIVAKEAKSTQPRDAYRKLAQRFPEFPISIQLLDEEEGALLEDARSFSAIAPNIVVKLPMFGDGRGLRILPILIEEGISINITGLMTAEQLLTVVKSGQGKGPTYASLFFNRIRDGGGNPVKEISKARNLIDKFNLSTKIITGSIRKPEDVYESVMAGAHIVTITPPVFWAMINHPKSVEFIEQCQNSWNELIKLQKEGNSEIAATKLKQKTRQIPRKRPALR